MSYFYYAEDNTPFRSKIDALTYREKTGYNLFVNYYDDVYSNLNWKKEPPLSLYQYYVLQAQRIRDTYDKVILCFSGGYDSTQILEVFHKNNIKLDKIIIVGSFSQDSDSDSDENQNIESYKNAFPYIDKLGLSNICEKIDYTEYFNDISKQLNIVQYGSNWIDEMGTRFSPTHMVWRQMEEIVVPNEWRSKKTALVLGMERTTLFSEDGKYGFRFSDMTLCGLGNCFGTNYSDRIYFFWDPSFPEIIIKQLHLIHRSASMVKGKLKTTTEDAISFLNQNVLELRRKDSGGLQSLHYNIEVPLSHKSPKNSNCLLSKKDTFIRKNVNEGIYEFYKSGILNMKERILFNGGNYTDFYKKINTTIYSKFYSIN
jgi:hypothetical protein